MFSDINQHENSLDMGPLVPILDLAQRQSVDANLRDVHRLAESWNDTHRVYSMLAI
jgi:hypothetical protein